jgi:hypothetical protein
MAKRKTREAAAGPYPYIAEGLQALAEPLAGLVPDPRNAREHSGANLTAVMRSLTEHGQVSPIVVNARNNQVVIGNCRMLAAQTLGWSHIAVVRRSLTAAQQRSLSIADNRTAEMASWNDAILQEILDNVQEESPDIFTDLMLSELLHELPGESQPAEAKPDPPPEKMNTYQVVVQCTDALDRRRLIRALKDQGRRCRALTWEGQVDMPGNDEASDADQADNS